MNFTAIKLALSPYAFWIKFASLLAVIGLVFYLGWAAGDASRDGKWTAKENARLESEAEASIAATEIAAQAERDRQAADAAHQANLDALRAENAKLQKEWENELKKPKYSSRSLSGVIGLLNMEKRAANSLR